MILHLLKNREKPLNPWRAVKPLAKMAFPRFNENRQWYQYHPTRSSTPVLGKKELLFKTCVIPTPSPSTRTKGNSSNFNNCHGISLLSIRPSSIKQVAEPCRTSLPRGTVPIPTRNINYRHGFLIMAVAKRQKNPKKPLNITKAFDLVIRKDLIIMLQRIGCPQNSLG